MTSDNFFIEDFTETNYRRLLKLAKEKYIFAFFNQMDIEKPHVLWRHDCDFSIHRAKKLSEVESEVGVKSTYFILMHSPFYNVFETEICKRIREIISLGHQIGLHFDQSFWQIPNAEILEQKIQFEKDILENLLEEKLSAVSFHNPIFDASIDIRKDTYADLVNAYAPQIYDEYKYVSDSNGYWRYDRLEDVLIAPNYTKLQILTHPEWWVHEPMMPRQRVQRCIDGRANACGSEYDKFFVNNVGRLNVK